MMNKPTVVGRSSSHFTRVTRIYAAELGVDCAFRVVPDLTSSDAADYAGNPALRVPILETATGVWFGALNICRELARRAVQPLRLLWPEDLQQPLLSNAQELTVQAMLTEVSLIMAKLAGVDLDHVHCLKLRRSLDATLAWLEEKLPDVLAALPAARDLSYLEVTLFCLATHLPFRGIASLHEHTNLRRFGEQFGQRPSATATTYRLDR